MRHHRTVLMLLLLPACVSAVDEGPGDDPRIGELGRVRFAGGGGCNSSTTIALGSTARLTLEPVDGSLPGGLEPLSTAPEVIAAAPGDRDDELLLTALAEGESTIELRAAGDLWDRLLFDTDRATSAQWTSQTAALTGATATVEVSAIYGACGSECPLIGADFIAWEVEPAAALQLVADRDRVASFAVGVAVGPAVIRGYDPTSRQLLVTQTVHVVDPADAGEPVARLRVVLPDQTVLDPVDFPVDVPVGSVVQPFATATTVEGFEIPLTTAEAEWEVVVGAGAIEAFDGATSSREGPLFSAVGAGEVVFGLTVSLLDHRSEHRFVVVE
jgi:hypothetical protein